MTRTLGLVTVLCMVFGGSAYAGHGGGHGMVRGGGHGGGGGGVVVRDHRSGPPVMRGGGGPVVRDHRGPSRVVVSNGRYVFPGGVVRTYRRPVIRERYYNVHVRPAVIVESYDPVPGYVWVAGNWTWGGAEWIWTPGYWSVAAEPVYVEPAPPPVVQGGVSVSAGISIH